MPNESNIRKMRMSNSLKTILLEEAIRLMALIGIVIFGVFPVAYTLGADMSKVAKVTLPIPFLIFPIIVGVRVRTGRKFRVGTKRGWRIMTITVYLLSIVLATLLAINLHVTVSKLIIWITVSGLMTGLIAWLGPRMIHLQ